MTRVLQTLLSHPAVMHADDERNLGHGIIVVLKEGYDFSTDPGCGTRAFETPTEALAQVRSTARMTALKPPTNTRRTP